MLLYRKLCYVYSINLLDQFNCYKKNQKSIYLMLFDLKYSF